MRALRYTLLALGDAGLVLAVVLSAAADLCGEFSDWLIQKSKVSSKE